MGIFNFIRLKKVAPTPRTNANYHKNMMEAAMRKVNEHKKLMEAAMRNVNKHKKMMRKEKPITVPGPIVISNMHTLPPYPKNPNGWR